MNVMIMQRPNMVLRKSISGPELGNVELNLLNLDLWPMWNEFANRILSENRGDLVINQRFDLHRVVAQQLIEDMWSVETIRKGEKPKFSQLVLKWQGQRINGRSSALAIKYLCIDITILYSDEGGVEVSAWWELSRFSKLFGFGSKLVSQITKQIFEDLTNNGVKRFNTELGEIS